MAMMRVIRQFVLLLAMMFWQGGFMFYGSVVVPVGSRILKSDIEQGFITQAVTNYLNVAGLVCLLVWTENLWHERRNGVAKVEWGVLIFAFMLLFALILLHRLMDGLLDAQITRVLDPVRFGLLHRLYLGVSTVQWIASLLLLFLAIGRWNCRPEVDFEKTPEFQITQKED